MGDPQRRTFLNPTTEGDQRQFDGQGEPQSKDASGNGANWYLGVQSEPQAAGQNAVESRLSYEGTVTATDMGRATDVRGGGRIGVLGSQLSHSTTGGGAYSQPLGRTVNTPYIAWLPGHEPPGWGQGGGLIPMKEWAPGLEPPGWNDGFWQLAGAETDIAWLPGQEPPGWNELPVKPMMDFLPGHEPPGWNNWNPMVPKPMIGGTADLRLHRGVLQPPPTTLQPRLQDSRGVWETHRDSYSQWPPKRGKSTKLHSSKLEELERR
jgi:hypothetical protein